MTSPLSIPQARRSILVAAASALLLAGCAGRGPGPVQPTGPLRYQVALLVPLSGPDGAIGQALANAARLAAADMNAASVNLAVYNTAEGGAGAAAARAIASGNRLILGPLLAEEVRAVAPVARRARVPVIAYSNDQSAAGAGVFILGFVPAQSIDRVTAFARADGRQRFAALAPVTVYGQRSVQSFAESVQRSGGQLAAVSSYAAPSEARAVARRLSRQGGFDSVLIADGPRTAATAAPAFRSGTQLLGTDLWAADRSLGSTPAMRGALYAAPNDERFRQFASRYSARFGSAPPRLASLGYDSMLLTISATRHWNPRRRFPLDVLTYPEGFVGVDGVFRFGRDGVAQRALEVRRVTASGTTVVSPAPASFAR